MANLTYEEYAQFDMLHSGQGGYAVCRAVLKDKLAAKDAEIERLRQDVYAFKRKLSDALAASGEAVCRCHVDSMSGELIRDMLCSVHSRVAASGTGGGE